MPDGAGNLSDEERTKAANFINEKAQLPGDPCSHCGSTSTTVAEQSFRLSVATPGPLALAHVQVIPVACNNCGLIRLFSGYTLGIVPRPANVAAPDDNPSPETDQGAE